MLLERAEMLIKDGLEAEFANAMKDKGLPILRSLPGVKFAHMGRGVESSDKFMLLVEWATMESHNAFTQSPTFGEFLQVVRPYSKGGSMEHFEMSEC